MSHVTYIICHNIFHVTVHCKEVKCETTNDRTTTIMQLCKVNSKVTVNTFRLATNFSNSPPSTDMLHKESNALSMDHQMPQEGRGGTHVHLTVFILT